MNSTIAVAVNETFRLYEDEGQSQYLGEDVTITQHSIQCAMCAEKDGAVREVTPFLFYINCPAINNSYL